MVVHVLGEVERPGEYRVPDDTDVLELISKAGGGSQFANYSSITITRLNPQPVAYDVASSGTNGGSHASERIIQVNLEEILKGKSATPVPMLQPGDVVSVPRNGWFKWRTAAAVLRDLSVVFTAYLLAVRTFDD
jgi:protein involved in polysaccharide export with SLBB domain